MIKILKYLNKKYIPFVIIIVGLLLGQVICDVNIPTYLGNITSFITTQVTDNLAGGSMNNTNEIIKQGLIMLALSAGSIGATIVVSFLSSFVATRFSADLRDKMYSKVNSFSKEEISRFQTASLVTRSTNDIAQIQMALIFSLRLLVTSPLTIIMALVKVRTANISLILAVITAVATLLIMITVIFVLAIPKFKKIQQAIDNINLHARENLMGVRVIRAYNAFDFQNEKYEVANDEYYKLSKFANKALSFYNPGMQLILNMLNLALIFLLAFLINSHAFGVTPEGITASLATQMTFQGLAMQIFFSFMMLIMLFIMLPRAQISAKRVIEVLDTKPTILDPIIESIIDYNSLDPIIELKNVSFKYHGAEEYVLKDINVKCYKNETVAFIGSTGSGKSTLINLIPRFFDVTSGEVLYHGVNVKDIKQSTLRSSMGYVPQQGFLFNDTIRKNMQISKPDASDEEINEALKIACAYDFVYQFENNLDYQISQSGKNVSGGQRQRLAIARAVVKKPEIYIFDDSFSALDYKTDRAVRTNLKNITNDSLTLIVSQRIGTILHADKIVYLDNGEVKGIGNHKYLLDNCEEYKQMALSQLSSEELGL